MGVCVLTVMLRKMRNDGIQSPWNTPPTGKANPSSIWVLDPPRKQLSFQVSELTYFLPISQVLLEQQGLALETTALESEDGMLKFPLLIINNLEY